MSMPAETADGGALECLHCGDEFDVEGDLHWHWRTEHFGELTDEEQFKAASAAEARLLDSVDTDVTVTIPEDVWTDLVEFEFDDDVDPETVTPADVSGETLHGAIATEYHWRVEGRAD